MIETAPPSSMPKLRAGFSPASHPYEAEELRQAKSFSLGRIPNTDAAHALTARIAEDIRPHLGKRAQKAIGTRDKGRERRVNETGIILAGLLWRGLRGTWSAVNQSPSAWFWQKTRQLPMKHGAFWTKIEAMRALGLLDFVPGKAYVGSFGDYLGHASRLRPSKQLLELAHRYRCTSENAAHDWKLIKPAPVEPLSAQNLVVFNTVPRKRNGRVDASSKQLMDIPSGCEDLQAFMQSLTQAIARSTFTGCSTPVLQASFSGRRELGGRIYAQGADNYQTLTQEERKQITINDEPVAELDLSASFLSIALALLKQAAPEGDPYDLPGLAKAHREAIKHWFVTFWQTGRAPTKWSDRTSQTIRDSIAPTDITNPAFEHYPALKNVKAILPKELLESVGTPMQNWAVGQYLVGVEASIMRQAMNTILEAKGIALPMHDGLIVPQSHLKSAQEALDNSMLFHLKRKIRLTTKTI
ncbi:hypothetical protein NKW55_10395 [Gluconobacter kondonii]|uniref:hypothetical protein n=1 Tax=Gluconobacter kondonii TaxID=941463 RepID=UPI0020A19698|nr:hypothetical protein [Gluconobacter kondonii]MCP1237013.1 hypothetical protein [Gluconobacter kondonii]